MATGADLLWRSPEAQRESYRVRLYAERQDGVGNETDFALTHAFDDDWAFRPNLVRDRVEEVGGEITFLPWWGTDPRVLCHCSVSSAVVMAF